ncbi:MAG: Uncharacterised protein [Cyanobium sp. ARS6]|nr:MAG: Uncharacterised protein [Cyanobium sp. ARS6]
MPVTEGDVIDLITRQGIEAKLVDLALTTENLNRAMGHNHSRFHRIKGRPLELIEPERWTLAVPLSLQGTWQQCDS